MSKFLRVKVDKSEKYNPLSPDKFIELLMIVTLSLPESRNMPY